jgi:hypothetical protein
MKKYRVLQDCHFANRYWDKDEVAEFPSDLVLAPHVFEEIKGPVAPNVVAVPVPMTMSEINESNKVNAPKTGMAFTPEEKPTEEPVEEDAYEKKFGRKKPGPKSKGQ